MASKLRWGIIGAGSIAGSFARGVRHSEHGALQAIASRSQEKAGKFGETHGIPNCHGSYEAFLEDAEVDAVYIATPHPMHAEWAIKCAEAGKHILCEKPITINAHDAMAVIEAARRNDVFLMEAFMYRCHPQTEKLVELLRENAIGDVKMIRATFGFPSGYNPDGRLFDNALGGGGILDVGCYATSISRLVAGVARGGEFAEPVDVKAAGFVGETGVDEYTSAVLTFEGDIIANVTTSVSLDQNNEVRIFGTGGSIIVESPWFCSGREGGTSRIIVNRKGQDPDEVVISTDKWIYAIEADHVAENLENRQGVFPAMTWCDTLGNMRTCDSWRAAIGQQYEAEKEENLTTPVYGRPLERRSDHQMKYARIDGIDKDISRVVMGCDNQDSLLHGSIMWDDFIELGGNCFDTAYIYGGGQSETLIGKWIKNRGIRDEVAIICKGAHSPHCFPEKMKEQFAESLERLQTDYVDIYFLHRDNPDVPVGEFVDVMSEHKDAGQIRIFSGSNWTVERVQEANEYAEKNGKTPFTALSNNFSLARMVDAPWGGCLAASDPHSRKWLEEHQMPIFPWSSQARGFFVPGRSHPDNHSDPELVRCWYSDDNFERQARAFKMADALGVEPVSIALAYVLNQPFPTFPLIGPRFLHETTTSFPALGIELTPEDLKYLNLED